MPSIWYAPSSPKSPVFQLFCASRQAHLRHVLSKWWTSAYRCPWCLDVFYHLWWPVVTPESSPSLPCLISNVKLLRGALLRIAFEDFGLGRLAATKSGLDNLGRGFFWGIWCVPRPMVHEVRLTNKFIKCCLFLATFKKTLRQIRGVHWCNHRIDLWWA